MGWEVVKFEKKVKSTEMPDETSIILDAKGVFKLAVPLYVRKKLGTHCIIQVDVDNDKLGVCKWHPQCGTTGISTKANTISIEAALVRFKRLNIVQMKTTGKLPKRYLIKCEWNVMSDAMIMDVKSLNQDRTYVPRVMKRRKKKGEEEPEE